ncbi:TIGR02301 family protein [Aliihoeflea sp. PC F10.4]
MTRLLSRIVLIAGLLMPVGGVARANDSPFEANLVRLSEVLGSLHFLRNLCGEASNEWFAHMEQLLEAEDPDDTRRARFVASFNAGYQAFESNYMRCTPSAVEAINRYMKEGETLSRDTAARYGN